MIPYRADIIHLIGSFANDREAITYLTAHYGISRLHAGQALVRNGISFPNLLTGQLPRHFIPKVDISPERRNYLQELSVSD